MAALVLGIVAGGAAAAIDLNHDAVYEGGANLLIDQPAVVSKAVDDGPLVKLSLLRLKYVALANTSRIAGPAAAQLGLPDATVAGSVHAAAPAGSLALIVVARSRTRVQAATIANAVAGSISVYADQEQQGLDVPPLDRYRFTLVQPASAASAARVSPTKKHAAKVALAFGAISAALAYAIIRLLSPDVA